MNKSNKRHALRKVFSAFLMVLVIFIGIVKIDIINTKALSPLGNTSENYKLVSEEFGDDFSNFIKDNSFLKIYQESERDILVRLGNNEFKIGNESIYIKKLQELFQKIKF